MPMTDAEKRAYQRGYAAGRQPVWPQHRPPLPPDPIIRRLMTAAQAIRDGHDSLLATLGPGDEFGKELEPGIDELDAAMVAVSEWLRQKE